MLRKGESHPLEREREKEGERERERESGYVLELWDHHVIIYLMLFYFIFTLSHVGNCSTIMIKGPMYCQNT